MPDVPQVDPYAGGAMLGEMLGLFRDIAETDVARARTLFRDAVGGYADHAEWRGQVGYPSDLGAAIASILPARSASRVDPLEAIQQ